MKNHTTLHKVRLTLGLAAFAALWFVVSPVVAQVVMVVVGVLGFFLPVPVDSMTPEHVYVLATPFLIMGLYFLKQWQFFRAALCFISFAGMVWSVYLLGSETAGGEVLTYAPGGVAL